MGKATKQVKDLALHPKNPRKISKERLQLLGRSMLEYGDISGIVFNTRTGNLIGGNQRSKELDDTSKVVITERFDKVTRSGTSAVGFIMHKGEQFSYREVDWSLDKETAAMIAANESAGQWDDERLTEHLKYLASFDVDFDLSLTMLDPDRLVELGVEDVTVSEADDDIPDHDVTCTDSPLDALPKSASASSSECPRCRFRW